MTNFVIVLLALGVTLIGVALEQLFHHIEQRNK
jgi:hypothetical protein